MKPAVVLVLICAIVGFLLGSVDNLTLPTITANREARAWATVNKMTGGGKKSGSGRGKEVNKEPAKKGGRAGGAAAAVSRAA